MACIDLLYGEAAKAREAIGSFRPVILPKEYTAFMRKLVES
jgi:hypothetical protein